jgi:hypothetical protein
MRVPNHITDLSRTDFTEIARAANMQAGDGIVIEPQDEKLVIKVDQNWIANVLQKLKP